MRLYERLPDSVMVQGKRYRLDLDFRNVLRMLDVLQRDDIIPDARAYIALKCIMRRPPRDPAPVLAAVKALLFPARKGGDGQRITDFDQDADYIRAAFRQAYNIDLYRDKVHWIEFSALLGALPEGSKYTEVLGIRARPMPKPTKYNAEERKWLADAKRRFALKMSEKEAAEGLNTGLRILAQTLLDMANKGGER